MAVRDPPPVSLSVRALRSHLSGLLLNVRTRPYRQPDYEAPLVERLESSVKDGDTVVIVGGGRGVTGVVAARQAGHDGSVTIFECSAEKVDVCRSTLELNAVDQIGTVQAAAVGPVNRSWGYSQTGAALSPAELPSCEVLELDCEGAEIEILGKLTQRPRVIVVETHGAPNGEDSEVHAVLTEMGYDVRHIDAENVACGCYVLTALRRDS